MFGYMTKKNRKIANLEAKINNRDILIGKQKNKIKELEDKNKIILNESSQGYLETKEVLCESYRKDETLRNISNLVNNFEFGQNAFALIRQIKNELAKIGIRH